MPQPRPVPTIASFVSSLLLFFACGGEEEKTQNESLASTPTAVAATPEPPPLAESHRIVIDNIGVDAPVATYGLDANAVPEVPTGPDAAEVVAWYNFSSRPGMKGNVVYAGHVTWNGDAVFKNLHTVAVGDTIRLIDDNGGEVVYLVTETFSVDPNDPKSVEVIRAVPKDIITLVTCGGSYFETSDPVLGGDYTERVIVRGELLEVKRAS
jgi:LPXTG-site transpeptidase (sortase) family protein